jgi:predicted nucleic acid-binding protein
VTYLLDVNALLALAHASHELHGRAESWVRRLGHDDRLATCAITELGFVRIGPQARLSPGVGRSVELLSALKRSRRPCFAVLGDRLGCEALPPWARSPAQTTDGHLVALARSCGARLATLDEGIPDSILIP